MASVIDKATGQVAEVPDGDVAGLWQSGKVQLIQGKPYQLQLSDGSYGHATADAIPHALAQGARFASRDEAQAAELQQKYGGPVGMLEAGAAGAASQATLGISDQLLPDAWRKDVAKAQQANPVSTMIGEGIGAAGLAAATGGAGALEEGVTSAGTRLLGEGLAARIATRAAAVGLRGAFEGAQYGLAKAVSDDAFSDHRTTSEHVLSTIGGNALWGGALGAAFGGLGAGVGSLLGRRAGEVAEGAGENAAALEQALAKGGSDADIDKIAGTVLKVDKPAEGLGGKLRQWYSKIAGAASGKDPDEIASVLENRQSLLDAEQVRDQAIRDVRDHGDRMMKASSDLNEIWQRGMKRSYIADAVKDVDVDAAANRSRALADGVLSQLGEMADKAEEYGGQAPIKRALTVANDISRKLDTAISKGDVGEMYGLTDDLKKAMGKYTAGASRLSPAAATDELIALQNRARAGKLQDLYDTLRVGLEDEGVWKQMGANQKAINQAFTTQIDASGRFKSALTTEIGRDPSNPWMTARGIDPGKAGAYVRGLLDPERDLTHKAVTDYVTSTKALSEAMQKAFDLPANKAAKVAEIGSAAQAFGDTLDKAGKSLSLVNQFEHLKDVAAGNGTAFGTAVGAMAHGFTGGLTGMAIGKVAHVFTHPADTIMQLATIERMVRESDGVIGRAVRAFGKGVAKRAEPPELASYARKTAQVQRMLSAPEQMAERIGNNVGELRTRAPKLADAMVDTTLAGLALLRDKLPPEPPGDPLDPTRRPPPPPPAVREQWLRYHDAVQYPMKVVESLRDGRVSPEGVEVLQNVYPGLYARVQEVTLEEMASGRMKDLSHQQRIGLGLMLQIPTDPTLAPGYILQRQAAFQAQATPGNEGPESQKPRRPVNLAKGMPVTAAERVERGQS